MKVGDIYEKDGKRYEILMILGTDSYSMREITEAPVTVEKPIATPEIPAEVIVSEKKTRKRKKV